MMIHYHFEWHCQFLYIIPVTMPLGLYFFHCQFVVFLELFLFFFVIFSHSLIELYVFFSFSLVIVVVFILFAVSWKSSHTLFYMAIPPILSMSTSFTFVSTVISCSFCIFVRLRLSFFVIFSSVILYMLT